MINRVASQDGNANVEAPARTSRGERACILVLGMHRSGTSALARVVSLMGATLPKHIMRPTPANEAGHWEPELIVQLHDKLLTEVGSFWDDCRALNLDGLPRDRARAFEVQVAELIKQEYADAPLFVLKDPRICRLVPFYTQVLQQEGISARHVLVMRNPIAVASSLAKRDGLTEEYGVLLWLRHVIDAERATRGLPRQFVSYEELLSDWRDVVKRISDGLDLGWAPPSAEVEDSVRLFLRREFQHHPSDPTAIEARKGIWEIARSAYLALLELSEDPAHQAALARLDAVRTQLEAAESPFWGTMFRELEARRRLAKSLKTAADKHERDVARLNGLLAAKPSDLRDQLLESRMRIAESAERALERAQQAERLEAALFDSQRRGTELMKALVEREVEISALQKLVAAHATQITTLDARSKGLNAALTQKDAALRASAEQIAGLKRTLDDRAAVLQSRSEQIASLKHNLEARTREVSHLKMGAAKREDHVQALQRAIGHRDARIAALLSTTSWHITAPLRFMRRAGTRLVSWTRGAMSRLARATYHQAPVPIETKMWVKGLLFSSAAPLFRHTAAYQAWEVWRIQTQGVPSGTSLHNAGVTAPLNRSKDNLGNALLSRPTISIQNNQNKKNILLVAHASGPQLFGAEHSFSATASAIDRRKYRTHVVLPAPNDEYINHLKGFVDSIEVFPYSWRSRTRSALDENRFAQLIKDHQIDLVHVNTIALQSPLAAARACGIPSVVHVREIVTLDPDLCLAFNQRPDEIISALVQDADCIIANSHATASFNGLEGVARILHNTVDTDALDIKNVVTGNPLRVGLISSNIPKKGIADFLELARICERQIPSLEFCLIGPENEHTRKLRSASKSMPSNFKLIGYQSTPTAAISKVNIVLSLSHFMESFGRTIAEAMAARRPVIAYNWGPVSELLRHGTDGYLIPFRQYEHAVEYLKELDANRSRLLAMGEQARKRAVALFSLSTYSRGLGEIYGDLLAKEHHPTPAKSRVHQPPATASPSQGALEQSSSGARIAVICHAFYPELAEELAAYIDNIKLPFDLYVSIPEELSAEDIAQVERTFPAGTIIPVKNSGRDVGALLQALPTVLRKDYSLICKIHTKKGKKSPAIWRRLLLRSVLGSPEQVAAIIRAFQNDPDLWLVGCRELYLSGQAWMMDNEALLQSLSAGTPREHGQIDDWGFFAGTMFWGHRKLFELVLAAAASHNFEQDNSRDDGQLAHALERYFGLLPSLYAKATGFTCSIEPWDDLPALSTCRRTSGISKSGGMARILQRREQAEQVAASGLLDRNWYVRQVGILPEEYLSPALHYIEHGANAGLSPSPKFDPAWYRTQLADPEELQMNPLVHYIRSGAERGLRTHPDGGPPPRGEAQASDGRAGLVAVVTPIRRAGTDCAPLAQEIRQSTRSPLAGTAHTVDVSVIIPNYNYARYLPERLGTIFDQTVHPREIIFLDDASTDNSVEVARALLEKSAIPFTIIRNETNAGTYRQWLKGIALAKSPLIWIAEADDTCEPDMLAALAARMEDERVAIAYCQSKRIDENGLVTAEDNLRHTDAIDPHRWRHDYREIGLREVLDCLVYRNTIPNVSACLLRKSAITGIEDEVARCRFSGDRLLYVHMLRSGEVAYVAQPLNGFRRHSGSATRAREKSIEVLDEVMRFRRYVCENFPVHVSQLPRMNQFLDKDYIVEGVAKNTEHPPVKATLSGLAARVGLNLRFAFITTNNHSFDGGSEMWWRESAKRLRALGHDVAVLIRKWDPAPPFFAEFARLGIKIHFKEDDGFNAIMAFTPDLVAISLADQDDGLEYFDELRNRGIPYAIVNRLTKEARFWPIREARNGKVREAYEGAAKVFFACRDNHRVMESRIATKITNWDRLFSPCHADRKAPLPYPSVSGGLQLAIPANILFVHKGQDLVVEVMKQAKWRQRAITINLYGKGRDEEKLKELIRSAGLEGHFAFHGKIVFLGREDEISRIWLHNHAVLMPSRMEGFPNMVANAMFCGRVPIVTDIGGHAEAIEDDVTGFIATDPSPKALDEAMERAYARRHEWQAIGLRAREAMLRYLPEDPVEDAVNKILEVASPARARARAVG